MKRFVGCQQPSYCGSVPSRCVTCGAELERGAVPDPMCWAGRADEQLARLLVDRARETGGPYLRMLKSVGDDRAAPVLREALTDPDVFVRAAAATALGWSGGPVDAELLTPLTRDLDAGVRMAARGSLTELELDGAADLLAGVLPGMDLESLEGLQLLQCLAWLRDDRVHEALRREVFAELGDVERFGYRDLVHALVRMGDVADRQLLAQHALDAVQASLTAPTSVRSHQLLNIWVTYVDAVGPVASAEVDAAVRQLPDVSPALRAYLTGVAAPPSPTGQPKPADEQQPGGPRVVPRWTMVRQLAEPPPGVEGPPAKFGGQPDWREQPAWPVGGDGELLMFYGQLPLPGLVARTAYIFLGGPDEWQPLGPGNAVVVQPGGRGHLPTRPVARGPQRFEWVAEPGRFRDRARRRPQPERFLLLQDGADPQSWEWPDPAEEVWATGSHGDWNKVGGIPLWLQGEDPPPGTDWTFAFQFNAAWAGDERGDAAECYGHLRPDGTAALGWQCG